MVWLESLLLLLGLLVAAVVGCAALGARRWTACTRALIERLEAGRLSEAHPARYDPGELAGLPPPVQRFFRATLTPGQPMVSAATVVHTGRFNLAAAGAGQWNDLHSRQHVVTRRPGFVWDARIAIAPGLSVRVHDAYVQGQGLLHAAVLGLFGVARLQGEGRSEIARGELMRFLAEAAWYPTALLPSQGVRWTAVDGHSALATLGDGPLSVSLLFSFDASDLVTAVRAEARGRMVGKAFEMAPWEGRWSNHQPREGMTIPLTGEVAWLLPEGRRAYWRGTIAELAYEWAT